MKKYIFTILKGVGYGIGIAIASFFLSSFDVHAQGLAIEPTDLRYYVTSGVIVTKSNQTIGGYKYYFGAIPNGLYVKSFRFIYSNGQFNSLANGKKYQLSFTLYNTGGFIPSVSVGTNGGNYTCYVMQSEYPYGDAFHDDASGNAASWFSGVLCPNVQFGSTNVYINVNFGPKETSYFYHWGISEFFTVTDMDNNSSVVNAIDNQSKEIGKVNDSIKGLNDTQKETNNKLGEMNDFISDDSPPDTDLSSLDSLSGIFPPGPLDSLLNIPAKFLQVMINGLGGTCTSIDMPFVFGSTIQYPCFDSFWSEVPDSIMIFLNLVPSAFILIKYFKHLYMKVDRATNMNTNANDEWGVI